MSRLKGNMMRFTNLEDYHNWLDQFNVKIKIKERQHIYVPEPLNEAIDVLPTPIEIRDGTILYRDNIPIVMALAGHKYINKFKSNINKFNKLDFFKHNKIYLFYVRDKELTQIKEVFESINKDNIEYIKWEYKHSDDIRTICLAAYLLGVLDYVTEPYYIKLDADITYPHHRDDYSIYEDYEKYNIIGQRNNYTKGIMDNLNYISYLDSKLFNFFKSKYKKILRLRNISISAERPFTRYQSFFTLYSSKFVKQCAIFLVDNNDGKMIIPSEDTYLSYLAYSYMSEVKYISRDKMVMQP